MQKNPWFTDFLQLEAPPRLDREQFVARYFPKYVHEYQPNHSIRMRRNAAGRMYCVNSGSGAQAVRTKRQRSIDEAFARYTCMYEDCLTRGQWVSPEEAAHSTKLQILLTPAPAPRENA